ncbi:MAG: Smr/MutS family protein [Verrucomicrobia bacterium]|nr:Smr/MutS family protein [Verrucomicrobiota bacterium]
MRGWERNTGGVDDEPVRIPITGELDLHTFRPRDVKDLVPEYLAECRKAGLRTVRVVHGKGIGHLRRTVHALLARDPNVESFTLASESLGSWGATLVRLKPGPPERVSKG